jgi:tape measure domain-containing protein
MATRFSELLVKIAAQDNFSKQLGIISREAKSFGSSLQSLGTTLALSVSAPLAGLGALSLKTAADMDALQRGLSAVTKEAGPLSAQLTRLKEIARLPGLGFEEAVRGSTNLQAAGFSANNAERALKAFGNALATVGKGRVELDGVILALGQISAKGKVSAEEINQLAERLPQIRQAMKDAFGTANTEELQAWGVDSTTFINAIIAQFEKLPPVTGGIKNDIENLRDSWNQALNEMGKVLIPSATAFASWGASVAGSVATAFAEMDAGTKNTIVAFGSLAAAIPVATVAVGTFVTQLGVLAQALKLGTGAMFGWIAGVTVGALEVIRLALAMDSLYVAEDDVVRQDRQLNDALLRTSKALRDQGGATAESEEKFKAGKLSSDEFSAALRKVALELGKGKAAAEQAKTPTSELAKVLEALRQSADQAATANQKLFIASKALPFAEKSVEAQIFAERIANLSDEQRRLRDHIVQLRGMEPFKGFEPVPEIITNVSGLEPKVRTLQQTIADLGAESLETARAAGKMQLAYEDALVIAGGNRTARNAQVVIRGMSDELKKTSKSADDMKREMDRAFDGIARGISKNILDFKGFGQTLKSVARETAEGMLEIFLQRLLSPLKNAFANLIGGLADSMTKSLGGLFGGASSAVSGGTASAGVGGAASAAGSAASGVSGIIGMATGIATAISSVIGNFQMAKLETTANAIEKEVRYSQIHLSNILAKTNEHLPKLNDILSFMWEHLLPTVQDIREISKNFVRLSINLAPDADGSKKLTDAVIDRIANFDTSSNDVLRDIHSATRRTAEAVVAGTAQIISAVNNNGQLIIGQLGGKGGILGTLSSLGLGPGAAGGILSGLGGLGGALTAVAAGPFAAIGSLIGGLFGGSSGADKAIVLHTLQAANELANLRADAWTREAHLMVKLDDIWQSIMDKGDLIAQRIGGTGNGGEIAVSFGPIYMDGSKVMEAQVRRLRLAGA